MKAAALLENIITQSGEGVRKRDGGETCATIEYTGSQFRNAFGNGDGGEGCTLRECPVSDGGDRTAAERVGDCQLAGGGIGADEGDAAVIGIDGVGPSDSVGRFGELALGLSPKGMGFNEDTGQRDKACHSVHGDSDLYGYCRAATLGKESCRDDSILRQRVKGVNPPQVASVTADDAASAWEINRASPRDSGGTRSVLRTTHMQVFRSAGARDDMKVPFHGLGMRLIRT